ncbi:hypothetical protein CASFOL_031211 [Castilleja foliolosa]|uniref:RRM domain-containing protein n=1 Tax=Castilleja foliolosa TaxID=1961234 RepID=A0ABD3C4Z9_9LAMI
MAFLNRVPNLLKQNVGKHFSSSSPSLFQAIKPESSPVKVIVRDLSPNCYPWELEEAFCEHGPVLKVQTFVNSKPVRREAYGIVTFYTMEAAESAIEAFNGRFADGHTLSVAFADEKEDDGYTKSGVLSMFETNW